MPPSIQLKSGEWHGYMEQKLWVNNLKTSPLFFNLYMNPMEVIMNCLISMNKSPMRSYKIQNYEPISPFLINPTVLTGLVHYISQYIKNQASQYSI